MGISGTTLVRACAAVSAAVLLSACSGRDEPDSTAAEKSASSDTRPTDGSADTSPEGRLAFGCAVQRGLGDEGGTTGYYSVDVARGAFRSVLQATDLISRTAVTSANLWKATDGVRAESPGARAALLELCSEQGYTGSADLADLAEYACTLVEELADDRPFLASFGPETSDAAVGDPRRTDVEIAGGALFILALDGDGRWLDAESPMVALGSGDEERYAESLAATQGLCAAR